MNEVKDMGTCMRSVTAKYCVRGEVLVELNQEEMSEESSRSNACCLSVTASAELYNIMKPPSG